MIAGAGAEGCFLIPFSLSIELVGIKVHFIRGKWVNLSPKILNSKIANDFFCWLQRGGGD